MADKPRIRTLDSLRGIAAGTVVVAHVCGILITGHTFDEYTPLYLFRAAHESVIFFFLLSGYVLTYQVQKQDYFNYKEFIIQRFFRIYIPYFVITTITIILFSFFHPTDGVKKYGWFTHENLSIIRDHLLLVGNFNTDTYDPAIWSLVHEMRISLIFPLVMFVVSLKWRNTLLITAVLSLVADFGIVYNINPSKGYNNSYLYTVHYFSMFVLGGLIVKYSSDLITWSVNLKRRTRIMLLITSLLIFNYARMIYLIPHKFEHYKIAQFNEIPGDWLTALSAGFLMISAIQIVNKRNWLLQQLPLFLGKISYSLYLVHLPVIIICFDILIRTNRVIAMAISLPIVFLLSYLANKYIEKPAGALGKKCSVNKNRTPLKNIENKEETVQVI